jgi:transposase
MRKLYERCCGLDVHKKFVVACLLTPDADGQSVAEVRTFGTMTADLLALGDWLKASGCTHVAMESTGVYWKPIYNLLEGQFEVLLVNAQHLKRVPGRKTDASDAQWIAEVLQVGLLQASFVPDVEQRDLRDLTRYRTSLVQERSRTANRLQKVLEGANIKLASVASDVLGVSARAMLQGLLEGAEPEALAQLARGRLREKRSQLEQALTGRVRKHQLFLVAEHLGHIDYLDEAIARVSAEIEERVRPFEEDIARLDTIPGVNRRTAEVLLAEIGHDMSRFPDAHNLASWAGMCPGQHETGGKRGSGKTRPGNRWLCQALVEASHGASRSKGNYLSAQYSRLARRRGKKKAEIAVGHSILVIVYHLLTRKEEYQDLGPNYFDERNRQHLERSLIRRLERLGYSVALTPTAQIVQQAA